MTTIKKEFQYFDYIDDIARIVVDWKEQNGFPVTAPMDGDDVDTLVDLIRDEINLLEGNMTLKEYEQKEIEQNKPKGEDVADVIKNDVMAPFKNFEQVNRMCGLHVKEKPDGGKS
jgi:hypothetical protein